MNTQSGNYKKYTNSNPVTKYVLSNFLESVCRLQDIKNIESILDVGCGEGFVIDYLNNDRIIGLDISKRAIGVAIQKRPDNEFLLGSAYKLPFKDSSFDLVMALEVLEHLEEPDMLIKEVGRVASKYCIFSVPNEPFFRMSNLLRGKNILRLGNDREHVQNWSSKAFYSLVNKHYNVTKVRTPFPWTILFCEK